MPSMLGDFLMSPDQRLTHQTMRDHFRTCRTCRTWYARSATHRFCPTGRRLWSRFREAWVLTDDGSRAVGDVERSPEECIGDTAATGAIGAPGQP